MTPRWVGHVRFGNALFGILLGRYKLVSNTWAIYRELRMVHIFESWLSGISLNRRISLALTRREYCLLKLSWPSWLGLFYAIFFLDWFDTSSLCERNIFSCYNCYFYRYLCLVLSNNGYNHIACKLLFLPLIRLLDMANGVVATAARLLLQLSCLFLFISDSSEGYSKLPRLGCLVPPLVPSKQRSMSKQRWWSSTTVQLHTDAWSLQLQPRELPHFPT